MGNKAPPVGQYSSGTSTKMDLQMFKSSTVIGVITEFCFHSGPHSRTSDAHRGSRTSSRRSLLRQQSTMEQPTLPRVQRQSRQDNRTTQDSDMGFMNVPEQGAAGSEPETVWKDHQPFHSLVLKPTDIFWFCDCHHLFAGCSVVAPRR